MTARMIKNARQYRRYLAEVGDLVPKDPDRESAAGIRLNRLAKLVEDYEKIRFPIHDRG